MSDEFHNYSVSFLLPFNRRYFEWPFPSSRLTLYYLYYDRRIMQPIRQFIILKAERHMLPRWIFYDRASRNCLRDKRLKNTETPFRKIRRRRLGLEVLRSRFLLRMNERVNDVSILHWFLKPRIGLKLKTNGLWRTKSRELKRINTDVPFISIFRNRSAMWISRIIEVYSVSREHFNSSRSNRTVENCVMTL